MNLKRRFPFKTNQQFANILKKNLLPVFKQNSFIWELKSADISNPRNGITNNSSESMRLQNWKQLPLDIICF